MGTGSQPSLWEELPGLSVPALAVAGEEDKKFVELAREMERRSVNVRAVVVPGVGHSMHSESHERCMRIVRNFIETP